jgi:uncharacterized FlaG/YvyC family protein
MATTANTNHIFQLSRAQITKAFESKNLQQLDKATEAIDRLTGQEMNLLGLKSEATLIMYDYAQESERLVVATTAMSLDRIIRQNLPSELIDEWKALDKL